MLLTLLFYLRVKGMTYKHTHMHIQTHINTHTHTHTRSKFTFPHKYTLLLELGRRPHFNKNIQSNRSHTINGSLHTHTHTHTHTHAHAHKHAHAHAPTHT